MQRSSRFAEPDSCAPSGYFFRALRGAARRQETGELRADLDPDVAVHVFLGALELMVTNLVLGLVQVDGAAPVDSEYYLKVARTVVDIFLNGLTAGGSR